MRYLRGCPIGLLDIRDSLTQRRLGVPLGTVGEAKTMVPLIVDSSISTAEEGVIVTTSSRTFTVGLQPPPASHQVVSGYNDKNLEDLPTHFSTQVVPFLWFLAGHCSFLEPISYSQLSGSKGIIIMFFFHFR